MSGLDVIREPHAGIPASTPAQLLQIAVSQGASLDQLDKLMQMQERWEANEARKAFVAAMAEFKAEPITVIKSGLADFTTAKGRTRYTHAKLVDVVDSAVARMGKHGLSHRWDVKQEQGKVIVTCIVTHRLGHSEETSLPGMPDETGNKNSIQQIGSTITYLQRYTLMAALGLAASDMQEDDGRGAGQSEPTLSEGQQAQINDMIEASGADRDKFLAWAKAERISDIPASWFTRCNSLLAKKMEEKNAAT